MTVATEKMYQKQDSKAYFGTVSCSCPVIWSQQRQR